METISDDIPEIPVLLLGDPGVGKSTFLARLTLGNIHSATPASKLPVLRDLDQPFPFNITLRRQRLRLEFYDTNSPTNWTLLQPAIVILCYSISDPASLHSLQTKWKILLETHFGHDEKLPVIVLGLQRDARVQSDYGGSIVRKFAGSAADESEGTAALHPRTITYPQEALRVAGEMRCDRYCECSALTGDLCREVLEDIATTALATMTADGGRSKAAMCVTM